MMYNYISLPCAHRSSVLSASPPASRVDQQHSLSTRTSPTSQHSTPTRSSASSGGSSATTHSSSASSIDSSASACSTTSARSNSISSPVVSSSSSLHTPQTRRKAKDRDLRQIRDYFDLPAPLITCLVRHVSLGSDGSATTLTTTPGSVEQCVRELQAYFDASVLAESIVCAPLSGLRSTSATQQGSKAVSHANSSSSNNKDGKRDSHNRKMHVDESWQSKEGAKSKESTSSSSTSSNFVDDSCCGDKSSSHAATVKFSGSPDRGGLSMRCLPGSRVRLQFGKTVHSSLATREAILCMYIYSIDEPESHPRAFESVVVQWRDELQRAGMEHDALVMLVSGLQTRIEKSEMVASPQSTPHDRAARHTHGRSSSSSSSTAIGTTSDANNASSDSIRLARYFAVLRQHGFGTRQMCAYRVEEAGLWVLAALKTAFATRVRAQQEQWHVHLLRQRQVTLGSSHRTQQSAHAEKKIHRTARDPRRHNEKGRHTRKGEGTHETGECDTSAQTPTHGRVSGALLEPSASAADDQHHHALRRRWRTFWSHGVALATLCLQFGLVRAAQSVFEQLFDEFFYNSESYPFVSPDAPHQWRRLCRHLRHRPCHRLRLFSSSHAFLSSPHAQHEGMISSISSRTQSHPPSSSAAAEAQRVLDTATAAVSCSLMLAEFAHARRRWDLLLQLVQEAVDDADEVQRNGIDHTTAKHGVHTNKDSDEEQTKSKQFYVWRQGLLMQLCLTAARLFFPSPAAEDECVLQLASEVGLVSSSSVFASAAAAAAAAHTRRSVTNALTSSARRWWCAALTDWLTRGRVCLEKLVMACGPITSDAASHSPSGAPVSCNEWSLSASPWPLRMHAALTPRRVYRVLRICADGTGTSVAGAAEASVLWRTHTALIAVMARGAGYVRLAQVQSILCQVGHNHTEHVHLGRKGTSERVLHRSSSSSSTRDAAGANMDERTRPHRDATVDGDGGYATDADANDAIAKRLTCIQHGLAHCIHRSSSSSSMAHRAWISPVATHMIVAPMLLRQRPQRTWHTPQTVSDIAHTDSHSAECESCERSEAFLWQQWRRAVVSLIRWSTMPKRSGLQSKHIHSTDRSDHNHAYRSNRTRGGPGHSDGANTPVTTCNSSAEHAMCAHDRWWSSSYSPWVTPGLRQLRSVMLAESATTLWRRLRAVDKDLATLAQEPTPLSLRAFWRRIGLSARKRSPSGEVVLTLRAHQVVSLFDACAYQIRTGDVAAGGGSDKSDNNSLDAYKNNNNNNSNNICKENCNGDNNNNHSNGQCMNAVELTLQSCAPPHRRHTLMADAWQSIPSDDHAQNVIEVRWRWRADEVGVNETVHDDDCDDDGDGERMFCVQSLRVRRGHTTLLWRRRQVAAATATRTRTMTAAKPPHRRCAHAAHWNRQTGENIWMGLSLWCGEMPRRPQASAPVQWSSAVQMPLKQEHYFVQDEVDYRVHLERRASDEVAHVKHEHAARGDCQEDGEIGVGWVRVAENGDACCCCCSDSYDTSSSEWDEDNYDHDDGLDRTHDDVTGGAMRDDKRRHPTASVHDEGEEHDKIVDAPRNDDQSMRDARRSSLDLREVRSPGCPHSGHDDDGSARMEWTVRICHTVRSEGWAPIDLPASLLRSLPCAMKGASRIVPELVRQFRCNPDTAHKAKHVDDDEVELVYIVRMVACAPEQRSANQRMYIVVASSLSAKSDADGGAYSVFPVSPAFTDTTGSTWNVFMRTTQPDCDDLALQCSHTVDGHRHNSNSNGRSNNSNCVVHPAASDEADCAKPMVDLVSTLQLPLLPVYLMSLSPVRAARPGNAPAQRRLPPREPHHAQHATALRNTVCCRPCQSATSDTASLTVDVQQPGSMYRIRAVVPAALSSVSNRLGHALSVHYRFHVFGSRVYCVVVLRNNLSRTTLQVQHTQLLVTSKRPPDTKKDNAKVNDDECDCAKAAGYAVSRVTSAWANVSQSPWPPHAVCQLCFEITRQPGGSDGAHVQLQVYYRRWPDILVDGNEQAQPNEERAERRAHEHCTGTANTKEVQQQQQQKQQQQQQTTPHSVEGSFLCSAKSDRSIDNVHDKSMSHTNSDEAEAAYRSHLMSTCNIFYGSRASLPLCAEVLFRVFVDIVVGPERAAVLTPASSARTHSVHPGSTAHGSDVYTEGGGDVSLAGGATVTFRVRVEPQASLSAWPSNARAEEPFLIDLIADPEQWVVVGRAREYRTLAAHSPTTTLFFTAIAATESFLSSSSAGGGMLWHSVPVVRMYWANPAAYGGIANDARCAVHSSANTITDRRGRVGAAIDTAAAAAAASTPMRGGTESDSEECGKGSSSADRGGSSCACQKSRSEESTRVCGAATEGAKVCIEVIRFPEAVRVHRH